MPDHTKAQPFLGADALTQTNSSPPESDRLDTTEERMRQALGLRGAPAGGPRPQTDRNGTVTRQRLPENGSPHRRHRFVQDGEVPVVHVSRRIEPGEPPPQNSRIQALESANQAERAARDRAERALHATQAALHEMRTKLGHTELALLEAQTQLRHRSADFAEMREGIPRRDARIVELEAALAEAERKAGQAIVELANEKLARIADQATAGERTAPDRTGLRRSSDSADAQKSLQSLAAASQPAERKRRMRDAADPSGVPETEPEPVKWWLTSKAPLRRKKAVASD